MRAAPPRPALRILLLASLVSLASGVASAGVAYPLSQSANGRYLVDASGVPTMIVGDSPQALMVNVSEADAEAYFADRQAHGFNTVLIDLLCTTYTGGRADGSTLDGILPFNGTLPSGGSYDLGTPNEAYFAHADRILRLAAVHGLQVLLDPIETGGWLTTMLDNGETRCRDYGRYLGARYGGFDNILWMSGNDFQGWQDPTNDAVVLAVARGIRDNDARHLQTIELNFLESSSLDDDAWAPILGLNASYTYFPTYALLEKDYARASFLPNFLVEANYEFESAQGPITTAPILRKQEYWAMTSGATGQMYGNRYTWPFLDGWQDHLDTPGATQMGYLVALFGPRAWYDLVPDVDHVVLTAGYGTYSDSGYVADNDYATAARTPDGTLAIVYTPVLRSLTVDLSQLSAPAVAHWYDPSSGAYVPIPGSPFLNAGSRSFTPPGANQDGDGGWVLVLETSPPVILPPPPTDHLAAAYAFDEIGGTTVPDASGNGNAASVHGASFLPGFNGYALAFDGWHGDAEIPDSASLDIAGTGLTLAFWVKIDSTNRGTDYVILGKPASPRTATSPYYQYGVEYANIRKKTLDFYFADSVGARHGPYRMTPARGVWTHVAFTYDGATVKGYLDGVERLSVAASGRIGARGQSLLLGADGAKRKRFKGALDDLRIYDRALTPLEVRAVMQAAVGGTAASAVVKAPK